MLETIQLLQHLLDEKHSNAITMATVAEGRPQRGTELGFLKDEGPNFANK